MDTKKELSLIFLATSFLYQYHESVKDKDYKQIDTELQLLSRISKNYKSLLNECLKIAENEFAIVEAYQRANKPRHRFEKMATLDDEGDLVVSAVALAVNLLLIHKEIPNKKVTLDKRLYELDKNDYSKDINILNAQIVASNYYLRICKYYNDRKIK